jgi:S-adenosylmethionine:tRNA ribosyltransferase-isomerase
MVHKGEIQDLKQCKLSQWKAYELNSALTAKESLKALLSKKQANGVSQFYCTTQIMIKPGYKFKMIEAIITNFHQPSSTLLLLIGAIVGSDWKNIYDYALSHDYRFLSYGDSSLLWVKSS